MLPTLREVLELPSFARAGVVVHAGDPSRTTVRWVHSSEVFEMGGLLAGGELLLTTGLGLYGCSGDQLTDYVDRLADSGCVALALEVGRSFMDTPRQLLEAAERRGLVLLSLHDVVPFERMIEDFHDLIVERKGATRRTDEPLWQELLGLVVAGQGLTTLLRATSRLADSPVWLLDLEGHVIDRSAPVDLPSGAPTTTADVRGPHGSVGRLVLEGPASSRRVSVADRAAVAVALELGRHPHLDQRPSLAQAVVTDLVSGVLSSHEDMLARCTLAGWTPAEHHHILAVAFVVDRRTPARELVGPVRKAVVAQLGPCLVGISGNQVLVVTQGWVRPEQNRVRRVVTAVFDALRSGPAGGAVLAASVANPVTELFALPAAIAEAQDVARIARRINVRDRVVLARDTGVHRLIAASDPADMAAFVSEQLGPLLANDTRYATDLVRTLDAFLASGTSKARAAESLGIRRQSFYARLRRIESLLGVPLGDPGQLTCLAVAIVAWRMRTGSDPQVAASGTPGPATSRIGVTAAVERIRA